METNKILPIPVSGKLYQSGNTIILCTGFGEKPTWANYPTIAGVVVKNTDRYSDHRVGNYSTTWNLRVFSECDESVTLDNIDYIEPFIGTTNG